MEVGLGLSGLRGNTHVHSMFLPLHFYPTYVLHIFYPSTINVPAPKRAMSDAGISCRVCVAWVHMGSVWASCATDQRLLALFLRLYIRQDPLTAVLVSVTAVLFFGEIIPQALCSRCGQDFVQAAAGPAGTPDHCGIVVT